MTNKLETRYHEIFPINTAVFEPGICRDANLQKLLATRKLTEFIDAKESTNFTDNSAACADNSNFHINGDVKWRKHNTFIHGMNAPISGSKLIGEMSSLEPDGYFANLYEIMKRNAIYYIFKNSMEYYSIMKSSVRLERNVNIIIDKETQNMIFSWSIDTFLEQHKLLNNVYLDVMQADKSEDTLNKLKFQFDLLELMYYYKFIYEEYQCGKRMWFEKVYGVLIKAQQFLKIEETFKKSVNVKLNIKKMLSNNIANGVWNFWDTYQARISEQMQYNLADNAVIDPIEFRYKRRYYQTQVEMSAIKDDRKIAALEKELQRYKDMIEQIKVSDQCTLNALYVQIENYTTSINKWLTRYSTDLDDLENKIMYTHFKIEKAQDKLRDIQLRIEMFRERITQVEAQIEAERISECMRLTKDSNLKAHTLNISRKKNHKRRTAGKEKKV